MFGRAFRIHRSRERGRLRCNRRIGDKPFVRQVGKNRSDSFCSKIASWKFWEKEKIEPEITESNLRSIARSFEEWIGQLGPLVARTVPISTSEPLRSCLRLSRSPNNRIVKARLIAPNDMPRQQNG